MIAKRIGALAIAVALIVGAVLLRHNIDSTGSSTTSTPDATATASSAYSVVCSTEFAAICRQLGGNVAVIIEPAGITLDRLSKAPADLPDAWLTLDPFPAMLDDTRTRAAISNAVTATALVAATEPSLAMLTDRVTAFQASCGVAATWRCVGDYAGTAWSAHNGQDAWGRLRPSLSDPSTEGSGLVHFANAVAGYFNTADYNRNTWETDPRFSSWLRNLTSNTLVTASGSSPLGTLLVRQSALNIASTTTAEVAQVPEATAAKLGVISTTPSIEMVAVLATMGRSNAAIEAKLTALVQTQNGWHAPATTQPRLPAGTFIALRQLWKDAT